MWCAHCVLHLTCTLFLNKMMILTQCAHCFVQIQHVEMTPCLWCAHCVLHLTRTIIFNQNDDIDSVCAMFCANWACWSAPCFVVCPLCFAPEGLTLRKWVDFTLNGCAHAVGWLHAGWVDLTSAPSNLEILDDEVRRHSGPISEPFFGGTELGQDEVNHQISAWKLVHKPGIQTLCETLFPLVLELI